MQPNIRTLANALQRGSLSAEQLAAERLELARDTAGMFTLLDDTVLAQAKAIDIARQEGRTGPLSGVPITLKDLFDVRGQQTLAGSTVLKNTALPACQDGEVIGYLREAGLLFLGRTTMSEFAFSGMGLNAHYPVLYSVWDRETGRLPGGSSSGSAVSVASGIVPGTLGSDTAGSCRIPAAFNGIVGVKPSYGRLSLHGIYPLSPTSDTPGPLAVDTDSCFLLDNLMSGNMSSELPALKTEDPKKLRFLVPEGVVMHGLDTEVAAAFDRAVEALQKAGVSIVRKPMPSIDQAVDLFLNAPVVVYEAWQHHKKLLTTRGDEYDPYVSVRIRSGEKVSETEQQIRYVRKETIKADFRQQYVGAEIDGLLYPTVACLPPPVSATADKDKIGGVNLRCLRNTATVNNFDGCAISLPCHKAAEGPVGLMLTCAHGEDQKLYRLAATIEAVLNRA